MRPMVDTETLKSRFYGKQELLEKVYYEFSVFVETALPEMQKAHESGDLKSLAQKAHTLKGNSALIGAGRVNELAVDIQQASNAGDVHVLNSALPQLFDQVQDTVQELKRFVFDEPLTGGR